MKRTDPSPGLDSNLRTRAEPIGPAMEGGIEGPSYRSVDVRRIGQYTVLRRLGEGGMGEVFAAYDEGLDRKVAIKILRSNLRQGTEAAARMLREARKAARTEVCLNAEVRGVWDADLVDRAIWCLEDRQMELTGLVAELGRANATTVQKAVGAAAGLRAAGACLDEALLLRQPAPPAQGREAIREVRVLLSRAQSLGLAGDVKAALTVATQAREQASGVRDWPPLLAAACTSMWVLTRRRGRCPSARSPFRRMLWARTTPM